MAPTIGHTLHKARTDRGVDLSEVERATKIRVKFLEAMEDNRWEALPGPAYARGFLEIYARYLELDREALLQQYSETVEGERGANEPIPESVIKPGTLRQNRPIRRTGSIKWGPVAKVAVGLLAVVVVGLIIVGSIGGSDNGGGEAAKNSKGQGKKTATPSTTTTTSTVASGQVSVELRSTAPVWVCLVDQGGNPLVDGETLSTDEKRGPFSARSFDVTFGNGSVVMTVDDETRQVPSVAEPIGYRITPEGVRELDPSSRPTCT
jgi:cytoskeletal protein RodZ